MVGVRCFVGGYDGACCCFSGLVVVGGCDCGCVRVVVVLMVGEFVFFGLLLFGSLVLDLLLGLVCFAVCCLDVWLRVLSLFVAFVIVLLLRFVVFGCCLLFLLVYGVAAWWGSTRLVAWSFWILISGNVVIWGVTTILLFAFRWWVVRVCYFVV